ncbi:hypothetical protein [Ktedonobacter racemifer]|nr:hypothetical protein [Ktedonobacter racemifer]
MLVKDSQTGSLANEPSHTTPHAHDVLSQLDNSGLSRFHWKAMITSGMGFFTDAYDLFIIGAALTILIPL